LLHVANCNTTIDITIQLQQLRVHSVE